MELRDKYKELINLAKNSDVTDLSVTENNNILYISGTTTASVKNKMWEAYNKIDPDMRMGDLILNLEVDPQKKEIYEVKSGDNLNEIASKYPGMTWQKIYEANKDELKDPNKIFPGQKLEIPV